MIHERTVQVWVCDRCGAKAEFPTSDGFYGDDLGWLMIDLRRSLHQPTDTTITENRQLLCPEDVVALKQWFRKEETCPGGC